MLVGLVQLLGTNLTQLPAALTRFDSVPRRPFRELGADNTDHWAVLDRLGRFDFDRMSKEFTNEQVFQCYALRMERVRRSKLAMVERVGTAAYYHTTVLDLEGLNRSFLRKDNRALIQRAFKFAAMYAAPPRLWPGRAERRRTAEGGGRARAGGGGGGGGATGVDASTQPLSDQHLPRVLGAVAIRRRSFASLSSTAPQPFPSYGGLSGATPLHAPPGARLQPPIRSQCLAPQTMLTNRKRSLSWGQALARPRDVDQASDLVE